MYIHTYFYKEKIEKIKETREKHDNFNIVVVGRYSLELLIKHDFIMK